LWARRDGFQRSLEEGFDDRGLSPAFIEKSQADFLDQSALPVVVGNFIEC
jgi:hypothetical protein